MYTTFATTLKEETLECFIHLPPYFIDCFDLLASSFITQFAMRCHHHLTFLAFFNVRQEKGESLQTFIERLSKVGLKIRNMNLKMVLHYMIIALRLGLFLNDLCMMPLTSMDELRQHAAKFMRLEEVRKY